MTREDAIRIAKGLITDYKCESETMVEFCNVVIKALEQEPKWIPVSEKLPEDSGEFLVSVIDENDENYEAVGVAWFAHKKDYDSKESTWLELRIDETVIAWMPLPPCYEPQESESDV